jgi:hypothetical protein
MNILNPDVPYTQSVKTDITKIFRRAGWTPPSEDKEFQKKWEFYRTISKCTIGVQRQQTKQNMAQEIFNRRFIT